MSVTCSQSEVFSEYSGFLPQKNWLPWYNWNIVESGVKYQNPYPNPKLIVHVNQYKTNLPILPSGICFLSNHIFNVFLNVCPSIKGKTTVIESCITILLTGTSTRSPIYKTNVKYQRGDNCHRKLYYNTTNWDIHQITYQQSKCQVSKGRQLS